MNRDELRKKYGDAIVLGVAGKHIANILKEGFCHIGNATILEATLTAHLEPRLRCEAELDLSFKQIIPYLVLSHAHSNRLFTTLRIGGDERLIGQASLGLGGHMDEGEDFRDCLLRELQEEVGLMADDLGNLRLCGTLYSNASEVDSVHLCLVYRAETARETLTCLESDKLTGKWLTPHELTALNNENKLESWSRIVYDSLLKEEMIAVGKRVLMITENEINEMSEELENLYPMEVSVYYEECIHAMQEHMKKF